MPPSKTLHIMKLDTSKEGLRTLFKPYQILIMEHLWDLNREGRAGLTSGQAWRYLLDKEESRSRASIIVFFNEMVEEGVLGCEERTGDGRRRRVYYPRLSRRELGEHLSDLINEKIKTI